MSDEKLQVWRFTFGCGQENAGKCQPIYGTFSSARAKMFEMYGDAWSFQYSEDEWNKARKNPNRYWSMEEDLKIVVAN